MAAVLQLFPGMAALPEQAPPTIYTPERIDQLSRSNAVARRLRQLGYQVIDEDVWPDDGGAPILRLDASAIGDRAVRRLGCGLTYNADVDHYRTHIDGVRVCWQGGKK